MDQTQQALVRSSFAKIAPTSDQAAAMFFEKLFAVDPDLRPMFTAAVKSAWAACYQALAGEMKAAAAAVSRQVERDRAPCTVSG